MTTPITPTTSALAEDIVSQVDATLEHTTPLLAKSFTRVLAKALAGANVLLYKYAGWIFRQQFVQYASFEETIVNGRRIRPLVEWGRLIGVGDPLPAVPAELVVTVQVLTQTGSIPAGAAVLYPATGVVYVTTAAIALNAPTVPVTVRAASDQAGGGGEGAIGNLPPGAVLEWANPYSNVARTVTVTSQSVTGSNGEGVENYRTRVLDRVRRKPQGGALADYEIWGEEDPGIQRIYPYKGAPGEIDVYVEATVESSGSADGIPTLAQRNAVKALINADREGRATRRSANAAVNVLPITRVAFDVRVTGLAVEDSVTVRQTIEAACDEYLRGREPFIVGLSNYPRLDRVTQAALGGVVDDVVAAAGGSVVSVELINSGGEISAYTLENGEKAKLGAMIFV